jgi:hypothetical protein
MDHIPILATGPVCAIFCDAIPCIHLEACRHTKRVAENIRSVVVNTIQTIYTPTTSPACRLACIQLATSAMSCSTSAEYRSVLNAVTSLTDLSAESLALDLRITARWPSIARASSYADAIVAIKTNDLSTHEATRRTNRARLHSRQAKFIVGAAIAQYVRNHPILNLHTPDMLVAWQNCLFLATIVASVADVAATVPSPSNAEIISRVYDIDAAIEHTRAILHEKHAQSSSQNTTTHASLLHLSA